MKSTINAKIFIFVLLALLTACLSCSNGERRDEVISQTFSGNRILPDGVSRIFIDESFDGSVSSRTAEIFGLTFKRRINSSKQLSLSGSAEGSDIMLFLRLAEYSSKPVKYNISGEVIEIKLSLNAYLRLVHLPTQEEKLRNKLVKSELFYSGKIPPITSEYNAVVSLTDLLAEHIVSVVTTGWYDDKPLRMQKK